MQVYIPPKFVPNVHIRTNPYLSPSLKLFNTQPVGVSYQMRDAYESPLPPYILVVIVAMMPESAIAIHYYACEAVARDMAGCFSRMTEARI